jgi:hypothetical protein
MKKFLIVLLFFVSTSIFAQIQTSMYLSGDFNSWGATPMGYRSLGTSNWLVTIQYTGTTGSNGFKFRNSSSNFDQNWSRGDVVSLNSSTVWYNPNGGNGTITLTQDKYYTFTIQDVANSTNSSGFVMETSALPISITDVSDNIPAAISGSNDATVTITLSDSISTEENVFVRYTNDGWSTWTIVQATGSGTSYTATIPNAALQGGTPTHAYYVFTSTVPKATLDAANGADIDLSTIAYANNASNNYPLPVELTSFTVSTSGKNVVLNWVTATEVNNYGFEIERALSSTTPRQDWETIGFVEGHGSSNSPKEYSFTDKSAPSGSVHYRLKQIDIDGQFKYSDVVEMNVGIPYKFTLSQNYPNPFNPTTTIEYSIPQNNDGQSLSVQLKIYNSIGSEVTKLVNKEQQPGNYKVTFNGANLTSGIYFYRLKAGNFNSVKKLLLLK